MPKNSTKLLSLMAMLAVTCATPTSAQQSQTIALQDLPKEAEMRIIVVDLAPGESSPPHRHNAHVFVYVLEGEIEMQARGGSLMRLQAGDTFYEAPSDIHQVSRNASDTESARFVVHMLRTVGTPVTIPVTE